MESEWRQFAFAQLDLEFIGVIRRGMKIVHRPEQERRVLTGQR
jgi:hypothetical protein